jgi:hypothetical protein
MTILGEAEALLPTSHRRDEGDSGPQERLSRRAGPDHMHSELQLAT